MSRVHNEQVLTSTDLRILSFLVKRKTPTKIGEITNYLGKYHQRTKDRVSKLVGILIRESLEPHSRREKPYEIIPEEKEFVFTILKKFGVKENTNG